jgi:hypothetical protein
MLVSRDATITRETRCNLNRNGRARNQPFNESQRNSAPMVPLKSVPARCCGDRRPKRLYIRGETLTRAHVLTAYRVNANPIL